jgi:hypothetical protein
MFPLQPLELVPPALCGVAARHTRQRTHPVMVTFVVSLCLALTTLARAADPRNSATPLLPHVEFRSVHARGLRLGMTAADVVRIMGEPARTRTSVNGDVQMLEFPAEPIPTQVVLTGSKLSSVSLNVARIDSMRLPEFTQPALIGMSSLGVRNMLGAPTDTRHYGFFGIKLDQLIFERPDEPVVSIFFVADRVVKRTLGSAVPADIFVVVLPAPPDPATCRASRGRAVVGMTQPELQELFGPPKLQVDFSFNGQPAAHVLYQTRDHHTLSAYFIGGVLTEIEDVGTWSVDDISGG